MVARGPDILLEEASGREEFAIRNESDKPLVFVVEDRNWASDALTGQRVIAMPAFRRLSPRSFCVRSTDRVGLIAVMFTDLKGSTQLYDARGEALAYKLVRDIFRSSQIGQRKIPADPRASNSLIPAVTAPVISIARSTSFGGPARDVDHLRCDVLQRYLFAEMVCFFGHSAVQLGGDVKVGRLSGDGGARAQLLRIGKIGLKSHCVRSPGARRTHGQAYAFFAHAASDSYQARRFE